MLFIRSIFFFYLFWASSLFAQTDSEQVIYWPLDEGDVPPYSIIEGKYKDLGLFQVAMKLIEKNMPEYEHKKLLMSYRRIEAEMQQKRQICALTGGQRLDIISFSVPAMIVRFNSGVYYWPGTFQKEKESIQDIDIKDLESLKDKSGAILQIYADIYPFLVNSKNRVLPQAKNIFQMFLTKRVDYIFSSAEEVGYYKTIKNIKDEVSYKIFKDKPIVASRLRYKGEDSNQRDLLVSYSYINCPKTAWGQKVIKRLNEVLKQLKKTEEYKMAHLRWIPENLKPQAEKAYNEFMISEVPVGYSNF